MNTTSPPPAAARISIVGAGPGGLTCARILQRKGLRVTVHDLAPSASARNQGGTLDLHADDGQIALREAGLLEQFFELARPEGQEMRQMDRTGAITSHHIPAPGELFKPEIDRGQLRDLLLQSLEPGTVHWGQTLSTISGPAGGPRRLHFADGTTTDADLVIGADGAWSRVRRAVSAGRAMYISPYLPALPMALGLVSTISITRVRNRARSKSAARQTTASMSSSARSTMRWAVWKSMSAISARAIRKRVVCLPRSMPARAGGSKPPVAFSMRTARSDAA